MGDLQAWLPHPNGSAGDHNPKLSPLQPSNPHPLMIKAESWRRAEQATQEIIQRIQPTLVSDQRRRAVVEYVQKLIRGFLGTVVLPFGSVPLKTYLPDGDIDLTALAVPNSEDALASDVHSALEVEEQNKDAEFEVKDVQYIHAEVRLVKCLVQNIVVDFSFNQIGGLCTLCFLEQVDRMIGKDNLFKRSIILIKAWCYYESRILGAHHGLISTYALETLVLYIFHLFHSSLDGPLAVLYRFLDYYSKFDWDNYCISLRGPISVSSLPELVAEAPENDGDELLLSEDFLRNCADMFSDPPRGLENSSRNFPQKHLNIVDPLKESNNLGRSVSKGNFYRIRSAFTYGARKLGRILLLPAESIADEVNMFFLNTLDRHGSGERPDVQYALSSCPDSTASNHNGIGSVPSDLKVEKSREDKLILGKPTTDSHGVLCEEINNINISGMDKEHGTRTQVCRHPSDKHLDATCLHRCTKSESNGVVEGNVVSGRRLAGDAGDLASSRASGSRNETRKPSPSSSEMCASPSGKAYHAPHLFFHPENGIGNGISARNLSPIEENGMFMQSDSCDTESSTSSTSWYSNHGISAPAGLIDGSMTSSWSAYQSEYSQLVGCTFTGNEGIGSNGPPKLNHLADLSGDYDMHFISLQYAQFCREYLLSTLYLPIHRSSPSQYRNKYSWDAVHQRNMYTHMNANGVVPGPPFSSPGYPPLVSGAYGLEDTRKPRGTGTYFPNMNYRGYRERQSPGRGWNPVLANQLARPHNNGRAETDTDTNLLEKGSQDSPLQAQFPVSSGNDPGKPALSDMPKLSRTASKSYFHANGFLFPPDGKLEFGSFGPVPLGASSSDGGKRLDSVSAHSQSAGPTIPASTVQRPVTSSNTERPKQSYQLKNDDDFPPLTG